MPHNGAKLQTNPGALFGNSEWPFINIMKTADAVGYANNLIPFDYGLLDANGYPTTDPASPATGYKWLTGMPNQTDRPGKYVFLYDGGQTGVTAGTISTSDSGGGHFVNVSFSGANQRVEITPDTTNHDFQVSFSVVGSPYPKNFRIFHIDDEAALIAGTLLRPQYKTVMQQYGVIRFLDVCNYNTTNIAHWSDRPPVTAACYQGMIFPPDLLVYTTTSVGDAYSCAHPPRWTTLADKLQIIVQFDHTSTGTSATLAVGSNAAKVIRNPWGDPTQAWGEASPAPSGIGAGTQWSVCTYDQSLDVWCCNTGPGYSNIGLGMGAPPEACLQWCKEAGAHPWFCSPYLTCDTGTGQLPGIGDYMPSLAQLCKDYAASDAPWMIPRFETPNECWNNGGGFYSSRYAPLKQGVRTGYDLGLNQNFWIGTVGSTIGAAIAAVYGGKDINKYHMIIGYGAFINQPPDQISDTFGGNRDRLESTWYVSHGGTAAKVYATHLCYANYWGSWYQNTANQLTLAWRYFLETNSTNRAALLATYTAGSSLWDTPTGIMEGGGFSLPQFQQIVNMFSTWATTEGVQVTHYEGGFSPDFTIDAFIQSYITGISRGATTTINFKSTLPQPASFYKLKPDFNCAYPGMYVYFSGIGGTTGLNWDGTANKIFQVTAATPFSITVAYNSSGDANWTSGGDMFYMGKLTITGIDRGFPTVVHIAESIGVPNAFTLYFNNYLGSGNGIQAANIVGTTELNGHGYSIQPGSGTNTVNLNVDSTSFTPYVSGGVLWFSPGLYVDQFQYDSRGDASITGLTTQVYQMLLSSGNSLFPSEYNFSGGGIPFSLYYPNVYQSPVSPRVQAGINWNALSGPTATAVQRPRIRLR